MAEPNVSGKPQKSTYAKVALAVLILAVIMVWMTCASLGLPL